MGHKTTPDNDPLVIDEFEFLALSLSCKCILMHSVKLLTTYIKAIVGTEGICFGVSGHEL